MKLENQVCSLELAKKLKELGVKQDSLFYWIEPNVGKFTLEYNPSDSRKKYLEVSLRETYSAFTVAELGEILLSFPYPATYVTKFFSNNIVTFEIEFKRHYNGRYTQKRSELYKKMCEFNLKMLTDDIQNTEVNARAKMLIYLLENKLIKL